MSSTEEDNAQISSKSYEKLARFYNRVKRYHADIPRLKKWLEIEGDINYQVPNNSCLAIRHPIYIGNTALHFTTIRYDIKAAELLIENGADPTIKNNKGLTVIHQIIVDKYYSGSYKYKDPYMIKGRLDAPFVNVLLAGQVRQQNSNNVRGPDGFTHFHAACMVNDVTSMKFFLNNQVSINETVDSNSKMFPQYTPIHLAIHFGCIEAVNLLLNRGANLLLKDSKAMSPLHLAIERSMRMIRYLHLHRYEDDREYSYVPVTKEELLARIKSNESIINNILTKMNKEMLDDLDLSAFYVMHTLKDTLLLENHMENNINESVSMDSAVWPGYTALHFAARFDMDIFKKVLERGADIEIKDADGKTPFDLCLGIYDVDDIHYILTSNAKWREIRLSDGKTKLVDLFRTMRSYTELLSFIDSVPLKINNTFVPNDSPLWPGSTILHLAIISLKKCIEIPVYHNSFGFIEDDMSEPSELIELCMRLSADINIQDFYGSTALHLAFRRADIPNFRLLLKHLSRNSNPVDRDNVSHLHIACTMDIDAVRKIVNSGVDVNGAVLPSFQWEPEVLQDLDLSSGDYFLICAGSTPLNIAVIQGGEGMVKLLLEAGGDVNVKDVNGLTPIHHILVNSDLNNSIGEVLQFANVSKDCVVNGLSYLHVAASGKCEKAEKTIERLLHTGANINSAILACDDSNNDTDKKGKIYYKHSCRRTVNISRLFDCLDGDTPLHLAVDSWKVNIPTILIARGADVLAKNSVGRSPICGILIRDYLLKQFLSVMSDNDEKRLFDEMGVTKLHMACKLCDEKMIQDCVKNGMNVNSQIHSDSKIWPGYTPLHVLVESYEDSEHRKKIRRVVRFLLSNGADVTIGDVNGETPLMLNLYENHLDVRPAYLDILLKCLENTVVNPVSAQGISHFHIVCIRNKIGLIEKFLKSGVDVNQRTDYFSHEYPGYTPLHFAACRRCDTLHSDIPPFRTANILLKYGADVHAKDVEDNTPLHSAAEYMSLFKLPYKRILWAGADPKVKNIYDMVPPDYLFEFFDEEVMNNLRGLCHDSWRLSIRKLRRYFGRDT